MAVSIENGVFKFWENGTPNFGVNITAQISGVWAHIAIVRASGQVTLYVNGAPISSYSSTNSLNEPLTGITFCRGPTDNQDQQFIGSLANFHIIKGLAKYTQAFTPPYSQIQGIPGYTTILLLDSGLGSNGYAGFYGGSNTGTPVTGAIENVYPPI